MTIKHYGEYCVSCSKNFGILSLPMKCESCHSLVHANCRKPSYMVRRVEKLNFKKAGICKICQKEHAATITKDPELKRFVFIYEKGYRAGYDEGYDDGKRAGSD